jgi:dTDP-4-dehydrorhamnose 3,5-epimerase-like enzyme
MFAASSLLHAGLLATTSLNTILEFDYAPDKDETRGFLLRNWRAEAFDTSGKSPAHLRDFSVSNFRAGTPWFE